MPLTSSQTSSWVVKTHYRVWEKAAFWSTESRGRVPMSLLHQPSTKKGTTNWTFQGLQLIINFTDFLRKNLHKTQYRNLNCPLVSDSKELNPFEHIEHIRLSANISHFFIFRLSDLNPVSLVCLCMVVSMCTVVHESMCVHKTCTHTRMYMWRLETDVTCLIRPLFNLF